VPENSADRPPALSIIVPVYNVADYLPACLDSILGQDFEDVEIIVIDDAATDASPAIIDEYAAKDDRVVAVHLEVNGGLGAGRNHGTDRARGEYLMYVDSDDLLPDGALARIAGRIEAAGHPDVVMFRFARTYPDGRTVDDARSAMIAPEEVVRLEDRRDLLEIMPSAWNKVYRREFVLAHGFRFPDRTYEDIPFAFPVLMAADSIATLDASGYLYRQRDGGGSILTSSGRRHLDLFVQYDRLFEWLDAHPECEQWRRPLVDRLTRHVPTVLETDDRIPPDIRRQFFHAASESFRRHRPANYRPGGLAGVKVRLIERDDYRSFRAAQLANRFARRLKSARSR
jgi:hypothetical protein